MLRSLLDQNLKLNYVGEFYVDSKIQSWLKPHQIGGIRFMFDNINAGSGCILGHEMGLGKSL